MAELMLGHVASYTTESVDWEITVRVVLLKDSAHFNDGHLVLVVGAHEVQTVWVLLVEVGPSVVDGNRLRNLPPTAYPIFKTQLANRSGLLRRRSTDHNLNSLSGPPVDLILRPHNLAEGNIISSNSVARVTVDNSKLELLLLLKPVFHPDSLEVRFARKHVCLGVIGPRLGLAVLLADHHLDSA